MTRAFRADGQPMRLLRWLRANPGASSIEITQALRIVNVTGRVSDLRAGGYDVVCITDEAGVDRYRVNDRPRPTVGVQEVLPL